MPVLVWEAVNATTDLSLILVSLTKGAIPGILLHGIIIAYIWTASRSLAVAVVYHAAVNGTRDLLLMMLGFGVMTYLWSSVLLILVLYS